MSSLTYGSSMLASSAESWAWKASVFQVPQESPVKASVEGWPDHGPAWYTSAGLWQELSGRDRTKQRWPWLTRSMAYRWLIQSSGVSPGMETVDASQHQSSHQKSAPWDS